MVAPSFSRCVCSQGVSVSRLGHTLNGNYSLSVARNKEKAERIYTGVTSATLPQQQQQQNMGNKVATFSEEQLEDYQDCTYFTRKEILRLHKRFREMADPGMVPRSMTPHEASNLRLPLDYLARIPELKENPFRERIGQVFTRTAIEPGQLPNDDLSGICFEDFLEMMSVFSEHAPRDLKVFYAFRIYDFDEDGLVGLDDLERTCRQLVRGGLTDEEVATVCQKVLEESDIDGDGALSYLEFEHVVTRAADFLSTFHIRI